MNHIIPLIMCLLTSPLSLYICVVCLQTLVHKAFEFCVTKKRYVLYCPLGMLLRLRGNFLDHKKKGRISIQFFWTWNSDDRIKNENCRYFVWSSLHPLPIWVDMSWIVKIRILWKMMHSDLGLYFISWIHEKWWLYIILRIEWFPGQSWWFAAFTLQNSNK